MPTSRAKLTSGYQGNRNSRAMAARQVERLRRKFGFVGVPTTLDTSKSPTKRDNTFSVVTAATPSGSDSVGIAQDGSDISYFVEAKIGSSNASLWMLCDTGAGSTWLMADGCESTACRDHTTWSPSSSGSYKATGETFSIAYGTGSVKGSLADDTLTIGSVKVDMKFGLANVTSDDFVHFAFDGILGLSMANGSSDNFIRTLKSDSVLRSNVFGVDLNRNADGTNTGQLTLGGTDPNKYTGDVTYTPVNSSANGDWAIPLGDVAYNGSKAGITDRLAYIDTGTTYAFAPPDDVAALHKLIPGASSTDKVTYTAPCDSDQPIMVTFSGVDHEISAKDWLSLPSSSGVCTSNIYGEQVIGGAWLLGDVFLKNVYAVFDADAPQIGKPRTITCMLPWRIFTNTSSGFATKATPTTASASASATSSTTATRTASTESSGGATQTTASSLGGRAESIQYYWAVSVVALVTVVAS